NTLFSSPGVSWNDNSNVASAGVPVFVTSVTSLAPSYKAPAVAQFSLGVQHELKPSMIWVVQYVGNIAWHQNIEQDINDYPLSTDMAVRCDAGDSGNNYPGGDTCPASNLSGSYAPPNPAGGSRLACPMAICTANTRGTVKS